METEQLPSGVVTFMFTDIEGSTLLLRELGEKYQTFMKIQNDIFRSIFTANGGSVIDTQGDSFFVVFADPKGAVKAAVEVQKETSNDAFQDRLEEVLGQKISLYIRMGLHTGEVALTEIGYIGINVHKAARICSAGHGGQVLLSNETRDLVVEFLDSDITIRDMGFHRLKDLVGHEHLYQLEIARLKNEFPPLKSLDNRPNNLPTNPNNFIGREEQVKEITNMLDKSRLVTLAGPGGTGKTRLSIKVGENLLEAFKEGVYFVDLSNVKEDEFVASHILQTLQIKENPGIPVITTLSNYLEQKEMLLIIDNCEQVVDGCALTISSLLKQTKKIKLIITSRELLNINSEMVYQVPPLSYPENSSFINLDELKNYESITLFIERAISSHPNLKINNENAESIISICKRLDGIPLAIELAAARAKILSPEQIDQRLSERFKLLTKNTRDAFPRQQTLKTAIDWSHDLLTEKEKVFFRRLSVFEGGWTIEAAEKISTDYDQQRMCIDEFEILDITQQLVEKSLVKSKEINGHQRYSMYQSIDEYAREKLEQSEDKEIYQGRHFDYYYKYSMNCIKENNKLALYDICEEESSNFYVAMDYSIKNKQIKQGIDICYSLKDYWRIRSNFSIGIKWFELFLSQPIELDKIQKGRLMFELGKLSLYAGDYHKSRDVFESTLQIFKEQNYIKGVGGSLYYIAQIQNHFGENEKLDSTYQQILEIAKQEGNPHNISATLAQYSNFLLNLGELERAKKMLDEGLAILNKTNIKLESKLEATALMQLNLGLYYKKMQLNDKAMSRFKECYETAMKYGDKNTISLSIKCMGELYLAMGNLDKAENMFKDAYKISKDIGSEKTFANAAQDLAIVYIEKDDCNKAKKFLQTAFDYFKKETNSDALTKIAMLATIIDYKITNNSKTMMLYVYCLMQIKNSETLITTDEYKMFNKYLKINNNVNESNLNMICNSKSKANESILGELSTYLIY